MIRSLPRPGALLIPVAFALLLVCGCDRKPTAAPISVAPAPATAADEKEMTLDEMSASLQAYFTSRGSPPKTVQELVKTGFIKKLPAPPAGQEFAVDAPNLRVVLVNR